MVKFFNEDKSTIFSAFFDNAHDAILITKPNPYAGENNPEIVYVNRAFEEMTGYSFAEVIGRSPRMLQVDERDRAEREKVKQALQAWIDGDQTASARVELYNKTKSGIPFWVEIDMFPIWNADYTRSYWAAIQRNIDQKKYYESKIIQQLEFSQEKIRDTEVFLANTSHEMRTPLNAIIGFSEMLTSGMLDNLSNDQKIEYIDLIRKSGVDLKNIVDELLSVYKQDAFKKIALQRFQLYQLVSYVVRQCEADGEVYKGQRVSLAGDDIEICAEETKVRQVLSNLLYNSLKFTDASGQIDIILTASDDNVEISITDDGCGIATDELIHIFEPFAAGEGVTRKPGQGTGLGLPICHKIVEAHEGSIEINSKLGEGTQVVVRLPIRPSLILDGVNYASVLGRSTVKSIKSSAT